MLTEQQFQEIGRLYSHLVHNLDPKLFFKGKRIYAITVFIDESSIMRFNAPQGQIFGEYDLFMHEVVKLDYKKCYVAIDIQNLQPDFYWNHIYWTFLNVQQLQNVVDQLPKGE